MEFSRQSAPGCLWGVCKAIYRAFPTWKPASPEDHPSPQAPSKDPAEGFVDFFFGLVGVDVEVGVAGQHCGQVGLPAVVEDVAGGADLFGVCQFVADS